MGDSHADSSCRRRVLSCRKTEHAPLSEIAIYSDTHHWKIIHEIEGSDGQFSGWQAASGALASTLGAGNIVGTAMAIAFGGPGSVFWLWIAGLAACAVKYTEVTTAMLYREIDQKGNWVGGPQYYLGNATGWKWTGELYTILCLFALFSQLLPKLDQESIT